jgi:hypothetical protein
VSKQKAGSITEEMLQLNSEYLIKKYCAKTTETPNFASSLSLGEDCEMRWGDRFGETVYWTSCSTFDRPPPLIVERRTSLKSEKKKPNMGRGQHLRNCLADYVRRKGHFVPEGQSTASVKSRSDMTAMCQFAIAHKDYYWEYLKLHPERGR